METSPSAAQPGLLPQDRPAVYCIRIEGRLDPSWSAWLNGMAVTVEASEADAPVTMLAGPVADQAALRGILNRLWDLNLTLVAVNRIENGEPHEP